MANPDLQQRGSLARASRFAQRTHGPAPPAAENAQRRSDRHSSMRRTKNSDDDVTPARVRPNPKRISPDGASLGRAGHGRQFTVGNIGNNGRIYLRPVVRPGTQRSHPPSSQFPYTFQPDTPHSAGTDRTKPRRPSSSIGRESVFSSIVTPPKAQKQQEQKPAEVSEEQEALPVQPPPKPGTHKRSHSFSTVNEHAPRPSLDNQGTFKVVIHRPSVKRKQTAPAPPLPVLEVPIPHYRLGTPQFAAGGRAILRSSLYTRSSGRDDPRPSNASNAGYDKLVRTNSALHSSYISRRHSEAFPQPLFHRKSTADMVGARASLPAQSEVRQSIVAVAPRIYDSLTLNPDDPSVVRFASNTDEIVAATPSRLIAHITSPSFLDYELLSDFFLTFRSFVQPDELVSFLVSRLRWAVDRADDFGRIVRVRTFVALRHWILNYFVDDFVPDFELRKHFCELVNGVYEYLRNRADGGAGDIKIIGELKKCWRRTCALYWDNPDPFARESPEDDILPGGQLSSTHSEGSSIQHTMTPVQTPQDAKPVIVHVTHPAKHSTTKAAELPRGPQHGTQPSLASAPYSFPYSMRTTTEQGVPLSPSSEQSAHVVSCSIPMKPIYRSEPGAEIPLFPHPVPAPTLTISPSPTTVRAPHPLQSHKRSESFSDAIQNNVSLEKPRSQEFQMPAIYVIPGSLVRGVLYQPGSPYLDTQPFGSVKLLKSFTVPEALEPTGSQTTKYTTGNNPGVKKLLGSMRRALGNKQATPINGSETDHPTCMSSGLHSLKLSPSMPEMVTALPQPRKSTQHGRTKVRIDLLAAKVAETFKAAIEAGMEEDRAVEQDILAFTRQAAMDDDGTPPSRNPRFDRSVTIGSRSIVIVDDTHPGLPMMSGALNPPSSPPSHGTLSMYEGYVADATRGFKDHREQRLNRETGISIDSIIAGQKTRSTSVLVPSPAVYVPTGFHGQSATDRDEKGRTPVRAGLRQRFTNSMRSSTSGASTLRKYASYHSGDSKFKRDRDVETGALRENASKSSDSDHFVLGKPPIPQLRRRPGGDLKAVTKVHDLEQPQRPRSAGSISSLSPSVIDSIVRTSKDAPVSPIVEKHPTPASASASTPKRKGVVEDDANSLHRRSISLMQTHSSQPNLRPSFEAEVAKLAALPDDEEDDGGIEAALLKLEGRYEKKTPVPSPDKSEFPTTAAQFDAIGHTNRHTFEDDKSRKYRHHKEHVEDIHPDEPLPPEDVQSRSIHHLSRSSGVHTLTHIRAPAQSVAESEDSYSSIPLLERGLSGPAGVRQRKLERVIIRDTDSERSDKENTEPSQSTNSSIEHVVETDSMRRIPRGDTLPRSPTMHESFLLDDTQEFSDGSEELDVYSESDSQGVRSFFDDEAVEDGPDRGIFTHPLRHPDTPPIDRNLRTPQTGNATTFIQGLPTPGLTPTTKIPLQAQNASPTTPVNVSKGSAKVMGKSRDHKRSKPSQVVSPAAHLPFILAFDAEILAQQFTIIEKDALDEIDWKELIELRWKQSSPVVVDWVDYLKTQDPRGVDLVIARFNLVVKWIVSEIVLTESQDERSRCIVQYIQIALHCRRLRNYATMYQITIALLSADCSRLKKTWEHVPTPEQQAFKELEKLVQPVRNFHNLRAEMEMGTGDVGCIPFIGIYTRDLVYNSQKPPFITTPPQNPNEPLVNFERHHTAATIVKSLLRLLEASSKYTFNVEPSVITKCLWLAALTDDEITKKSKNLE